MPKIKINRPKLTERVSATVKKSTYETLEKYVAKHSNKTKSSVVNEALEQYMAIKSGEDEINIINKNVRESLEDVLKPFETRVCKLLAKLAKGNFTNLYLILALLEELSASDRARDGVKEKYEDANKKAYQVLKNGYINRDVLELFPETNEEENND